MVECEYQVKLRNLRKKGAKKNAKEIKMILRYECKKCQQNHVCPM